MRKTILAVMLSLLLLSGLATQPAMAQTQTSGTTSFDNMTGEDWIVVGAGALIGAAVGFFAIESGFIPGFEVLGLTEGVLLPALGAVVGGLGAKSAYVDDPGTVI